jgi:hypothetical protein
LRKIRKAIAASAELALLVPLGPPDPRKRARF